LAFFASFSTNPLILLGSVSGGQITALMYLILMVDLEEGEPDERRHFAPIINTPIEGAFR
jgi:hypothetical protein